MRLIKRFLVNVAVASFATTAALSANAQAVAAPYPVKPVTLVVGFAAGGSGDILARLVAQKLGGALGQAVIVENKPGAGGTIATSAVAAAPADGYTLLFVTSGHAGSGALYPKLSYDPLKSFAPVGKVGASPVVIVVPFNSPFQTFGDLIAGARKSPGKLNYAAGGGGATVAALAAEYLKSDLKIDMLSIPYTGSGPALTALLGGELDMAFDLPSSALPFIKGGKMRALAVTSKTPSSVLPGVPTIAALGDRGFEVQGWYGVLAPAATPPAIVARVNKELDALLHQPDVMDKLASLGVDPGGGTPADFAALIAADTLRAGDTIRRLNIKAN